MFGNNAQVCWQIFLHFNNTIVPYEKKNPLGKKRQDDDRYVERYPG